jgi:hypothetical protein
MAEGWQARGEKDDSIFDSSLDYRGNRRGLYASPSLQNTFRQRRLRPKGKTKGHPDFGDHRQETENALSHGSTEIKK